MLDSIYHITLSRFWCENVNILINIPKVVFVCLFGCFTSQINSYGHGGMVS